MRPNESSVKVQDAGLLVGRRALKISEVAAALGVKPISIRRLIARGLLKPCRVFRHVLIPVEQLDQLLNA